MVIRVSFILALVLLLSAPLLQVSRCQSEDSDDAEIAEEVLAESEERDHHMVDDGLDRDGSFSPAPGVETVCVFPKNPSRSVVAGEESELLVAIENKGEARLNVIAISASVHLPQNHRYLIQNLSSQGFNNATVAPSAQAAFPYMFAVSKFLQPGTYDLVATVIYDINQNPYQNTFYNGTFEVTEGSGPLSVESLFLFFLGIGLVGLLGIWIRGQIQNLSKKTKKTPKVEVGTKTTDASMDEWLEGTAYTQSNKSKKKK